MGSEKRLFCSLSLADSCAKHNCREPLQGSKDWNTATASEDRMVEREANFDGGANEGEVEREPLDGRGCGPSDRRRSDQHGGLRRAGVGDGDGEESRRKIYANLLVEAVRRQTLLPSDLLERKLRLVACLASVFQDPFWVGSRRKASMPRARAFRLPF